MALSIRSSMFSSPSFTVDSKQSPHSVSTSIRYQRARISAAYATTTESTKTVMDRSFGSFSTLSLYEVLGVEMGADMREVKSAYRRLARVLHPDVGTCDSSGDEFMKVHSAYATLVDTAKRAEYDRSLIQRRMRSAGGCRSKNTISRRWETDQCW